MQTIKNEKVMMETQTKSESLISCTIYRKLFQIQQGLKVQKNKENKFLGFNYRSAEQILEAVKPLLNEQRCVLTSSDEIRNIGGSNYIFTTVILIDIENGESVTVTANAREDENAKGLCGSQMTGVSSSYSKKYALQNLFAIDTSKDADNPEIGENIFKAQIDACQTNSELLSVWNRMDDKQRAKLKQYFTQKKNSL